MELTELSLASNQCVAGDKSCNFSSSSDHQADFNFPSKKRKLFPDHLLNAGSQSQTSVDLQVKDPLPLDWEQCLDLEVSFCSLSPEPEIKISLNFHY